MNLMVKFSLNKNLFELAIWIGLLAGLLEVLVIWIKKFFFGYLGIISPNYIWSIPLFSVTLQVVVFLVLGFFSFWIIRIKFDLLNAFLCAFVGCLGPLMAIGKLASYAVCLLAGGLAVQCALLTKRRGGKLAN